MRIENGKLVDYNYFDVKEIIQEAMRYWKKEKFYYVVEGLKNFIARF